MSYVELHASSAFSFLDGASTPENLSTRAKTLGIPAMALLDRDGVYGAPRFYMHAKKETPATHPHVGAEVTAVSGARYSLLAETQQGYQNLCRLITHMKLRAPKGRAAATDADFVEFATGLIALTGGDEGPLRFALRHGGIAEGRGVIERFIRCYGQDRVYVELQRHFDRDEEALNQRAVELAREFRLPLLATNGVRYASRTERRILDVFTCLRHYRTLETAGRLLARNSERHLKSPQEMADLFDDLPEAIANTTELSSRLQFTLKNLGYRFPPYPTPDGEPMASFLRKRADEGARVRFRPYAKNAQRQIERELALIEELRLEGYFLIVWDIVEFCRKNNILVQGRGSAANSSVCYALGITAIDPVKGDLLFERFLSKEREEWPDIDLDLPSGDQREKAIQYVFERYGKHGAAMTANVNTYRGRSAAREVGKVLGFDNKDIDRLARLVSVWGFQDSEDTLPQYFKNAGFDSSNPRIRRFLDLCLAIQDLPRHLSQHSGGLVICRGALDAVVPLEPATMPNRTVVQWDKDDCADMGIIKVDLLGLGMMAVLEDSFALIRKHHEIEIDLPRIPLDDPEVYSALQKADTVGMFQVESRAQMSCLPRMQPKTFYDIVVEVAIIRPGPIVGDMVHPYLNRRRGREKVTYPHPSLEPVLQRTLGVPLFQEQLIRMAMIAADFTGGEAEELRRAFGFKRSEKRMKEIEVKLRAGMTRKGIEAAAQETIIQSITSFALYGFPESHAASFALIANASAYLKCHYPAAFTAAILNNQPMGFYSPATLVKDAQRHGLRFFPIDAARSDWLCTMEKHPMEDAWRVRIGLRYARGLRESAAKSLIRARECKPFTSIDNLAKRVPELMRSELALLAQIGALNALNPDRPDQRAHRRDALWQIEQAARRTGPLLEDLEEREGESPLEAMTAGERLVADFEGTGLTLGRHPMQHCRDDMNRRGVLRACELADSPNGSRVRIAGCVIARQRPGTAKGFVFMSLEDETGIANAVFTPDFFKTHKAEIVNSGFLLLEGVLQNIDGVQTVKASRVESLAVTAATIGSHDFH